MEISLGINHLETREGDIGDYSEMVLTEVILEGWAWMKLVQNPNQ
jgi:hypothetical protein